MPGWPLTRMDELCEITSSKRIFAADYVPQGVPFFRGKEITERYRGNISVSTELFIAEEKYRQIERKFGVPTPGDLLLTSVGTLGSAYVVRSGDRFYFKDGNITWFRNMRGLDSRFLYYWLGSPQGKTELQKATIGSSQPALIIVLLKAMEVALPPLPIQRRIASILGAYDDLIEVNRRRIAVLEEMARRLFDEWFVHFRFPGHEGHRTVETEHGRFPEGWGYGPFTDVADVLSGGTPKKERPDYWDGSIPFFTPRDAPKSAWALTSMGMITESGLASCNSQLYPEWTVFITARGTVGKVALAGVPMAMNQSCYALRGRGFGQPFVFGLTQVAVTRLQGMSGGAVFDTIIVDTFRKLQIAVPPKTLAASFDGAVQPILLQSRSIAIAIDRLTRSRDLLLPRLISGELSVTEAERELDAAA